MNRLSQGNIPFYQKSLFLLYKQNVISLHILDDRKHISISVFSCVCQIVQNKSSRCCKAPTFNRTFETRSLFMYPYNHNNREDESMNKETKQKLVPIWERINLTLEEAAAYSGIGVGKLRELTNEPDCDYVLWIGGKRLLKRKQFEKYLEKQFSIWSFAWTEHSSSYSRIHQYTKSYTNFAKNVAINGDLWLLPLWKKAW